MGKNIVSNQTITVPEGVKVWGKGRVVTVRGPRGTLRKNFGHLKIELTKTGEMSVQVQKWFGTRKDLAAVRTICSHISNMATGVTKGYKYKMRSVYAHFPINCNITDEGKKIEIRNFLGEKFVRKVNMREGVCVSLPPSRRTSSSWKATTSNKYLFQPLSSNSPPLSRGRISVNSWTESTFPRRPQS